MNDSGSVVQVKNCVKKLLKIMAGKRLTEASCLVFCFYELEQIAKFHQLKYNEKYLDCLSFLFCDDLTLKIVFNEFNDIWMVKRLQQLHFVLQNALKRCETNLFDVMPLYNFDSHKTF